MTAEIAIINRSAVALATDSAVTLTVRGSEKIYNSADKLFELSDKDPIGVMVYNNLEYMGIPLEIAIKQFRQGAPHFKNVVSAAEAFFKYLTEDLAPDEALQKQHAYRILTPVYGDIRDSFMRRVEREIENNGGNSRKIDFPTIFTETVKSGISDLESKGILDCFADTPENTFSEFYSETIGELITGIFDGMPLDDEHKGLLSRIAVLMLRGKVLSEFCTGLVFAGFGKDEVFPALVSYEIDGVVLGKIKSLETDKEVTSRSEVTGRVLPFAQREMVDRFLYGIDPQFEQAIEQYITAAVGATGAAIVKALPKRKSKATKEKLDKAIKSAKEAAVGHWNEKMVPLHKDRFVREVENMIFLMPKQELALLAQELINLTSVKRKFSSGRESVGGPIDVAVISRIDGFVWVRRKHYFDPKLNPRYFHRKFGASSSEEAGS